MNPSLIASIDLWVLFSGFVYYEGDCFGALRNPYIPVDVDNPTMQQDSQRNLTGEGREERQQVLKLWGEAWGKIWHDKDVTEEDEANFAKGFEALCGNISSERRRIGGDWAIAGVVFSKRHRDLVRWRDCTIRCQL